MIRDIPEDAEAIDVCKAVEEMINESEERGELRMLVKQVRKGRITIEQAAEDANMSVEQFKRVIDDTPLQAVSSNIEFNPTKILYDSTGF